MMIPLKSQVKEIISKYEGNPPEANSNQKMNEYLKELGGVGRNRRRKPDCANQGRKTSNQDV